MTDTFTWRAHATASGGEDATLAKASFGNGYQQTVPWGLDPVVRKWDITVGAYHADMLDIMEFIREHYGVPFLWKPPMGPIGYYQCDGQKPADQGGTWWTLVLVFYQVAAP